MNRVEERELTIRLVKTAERIADALETLCAIQAENPHVRRDWYVKGNPHYEEEKQCEFFGDKGLRAIG